MKRTGDFELTGVDGELLATASMNDDGDGVYLDLVATNYSPEELRKLADELEELADAVIEELDCVDQAGDVKKVIVSREAS